MRHFICFALFCFALFFVIGIVPSHATDATPLTKPNIIVVLADDLAIGDLGCYGQQLIQTPHLDRIAKEGMRFTQGYCGTTVCAPSRASLMIGRHVGNSPIRANRRINNYGQMPLPEGTYTVAKHLKNNGYATVCGGKWGMGMFDTSGSPLKMGFDNFYGHNCQLHAHQYFPEYLYDNDKRVALDKKTYAPDFVINHLLQWIRDHKDQPFFMFFSTTLPHGPLDIDDLGIYADKNWSKDQKTYAAMCTRLDTHVGMIMSLLKELNLDDNTIIFFSADNGLSLPAPIANFFNSGAGLRGMKRSMYEGALRNPFLVRWPHRITANTVCDTPVAFWDFLPTCAELSGASIPEDVPYDGVSLLPLLLGQRTTLDREALYWELHETNPPIQAVRWQDWKFVRNGKTNPIELYDLKTDVGETKNLAVERPDIIKIGENLLKTMRTDDPQWSW